MKLKPLFANKKMNEIKKLYGKNKYRPLEEEILLRPFSRPLGNFLAKFNTNPDVISLLSLLVIVGVSFYINTDGYYLWLVALLLYVANILDKTDGDLARARKIAGRKGQYVDGFLDAVSDIVLISAWAYAFGGNLNVFLVGASVGSCLLFYYHSISVPFYLDLPPSTHAKTKQQSSLKNQLLTLIFWGRAKFFLLFILSALIGWPALVFYVLPLVGIYTILIYIKNILIKKYTKR